jgi:RNA polymerase sigma-B factor
VFFALLAQQRDGGSMSERPTLETEDAALFAEYARTHDPKLRERLIVRYVGLVSYLARQFHAADEKLDDLIQVGFVGLIKAIDRFDPSRGAGFTSYAVPTIIGEIRHYFRDVEQAVPLPRRLHELRSRAAEEVERLSQQLDRAPSQAEVAAALETTPEELAAAHVEAPVSLDEDSRAGRDMSLAATLRADDDLEKTEDRAAIVQILARLSPRERIVLYLRFYVGLSQAEVAKRLGISQMHVSRLQHRSLEKIKRSIET